MSWFTLIALIAISATVCHAEMNSDSISEFNIGQLFAFYNIEVCAGRAARSQFAVARKVEAEGKNCQWKIEDDFSTTTLTDRNDLPIEDVNGNCYFTCVPRTGRPALHAERIINQKLKETVDRSQFDLYSYLVPCIKCEGSNAQPGVKTADLDKYNDIYYTLRPDDQIHDVDATVITSPLLGDPNTAGNGLKELKQTTAVDLAEVKKTVEDGKKDEQTNDEIIASTKEVFLKNAVESYLDQYP